MPIGFVANDLTCIIVSLVCIHLNSCRIVTAQCISVIQFNQVPLYLSLFYY